MDPKLQDKSYEVIQKVRFGLHPAFGVPHMEAKAATEGYYEFSTTGFGAFTVPITIFWKSRTGIQNLTVDHHLDFSSKMTAKNYEFQMSEKYYNSLIK